MDEHNTYLGDGVYASFDGYQIWLAVNHHENNVVALDPDVFAQLCKYVEKIKEQRNGR
jgi:sulfur transfer complex TusBCD TusB component (DsrH family)